LTRTTEEAKEKYVESMRDEIMEFQRAGQYYLRFAKKKKKKINWRKNAVKYASNTKYQHIHIRQ
jgi:hypothetical protein